MSKTGRRKQRSARAHKRALPRNSLSKHGRVRIRAVVIGASFWGLLVVSRLLQLQVLQADDLSEQAVRQQQATVDIPARRGAILDRHGRELALSTPAESIGVFSDKVVDPKALAATLSEALNMPQSVLYERMTRGGFQWLKRLATLADEERVGALDLETLHFETESKRFYPYGTVAAHVLGTVGIDHQGQAGLEQRFDSELQGDHGQGLLQYDARQRRYGRQVIAPAVAGSDLILDLDLDLQSLAEMELANAVEKTKSRAGTIVLMKPDSGEVVAMSSWPRFDPNNLTRSEQDLENLRNFAVSYMIEPGSTFKVLTAAAALEEGLVTTADVLDCELGGIWIGSRRIRDHNPFGLLTMPEVLVKSSNVGIIKIGSRLGEQRLHSYIKRLGFGTATGVGLPGEVAGLVRPPHQWSRSSFASLSMGQEIGVTALQMARLFAVVANGGTLVSPRIVRALRPNGGSEIEFEAKPAVRVLSPDTAATMQAILEQVVESGTGRFAQIQGYRVAGKTGTAQMINTVSRSYVDGAYLASFCGFAPVNDPALVGVVMLYDPRGEFYYGGRIAAPVFSSVMRQALRQLDLPPSKGLPQYPPAVPADFPDRMLADFVEGSAAVPVGQQLLAAVADGPASTPLQTESEMASPQEAAHPDGSGGRGQLAREAPDPPAEIVPEMLSVVVPDLLGLTMREAFSLATSLGIKVAPNGSGVAYKQSPEPNEVLAQDQVLQLYFGLAPVAPSATEPGAKADGG